MASTAVQLPGFFLGLLGFAGAAAATPLLPQRRRAASVGTSVIIASGNGGAVGGVSVGQQCKCQCELSRSPLPLPQHLQVWMVDLGHVCCFWPLLALCGAICFLRPGVLCLVTVAWTTSGMIMDFYNLFIKGLIRLAVYLGYASAFLSLMGRLELQE